MYRDRKWRNYPSFHLHLQSMYKRKDKRCTWLNGGEASVHVFWRNKDGAGDTQGEFVCVK